jgi:cytochrome c553
MFLSAMRTGKHMGAGRPILPPMPWQAAANLSDDDLKAMFAYLKSIPAIANRVPEPVTPNQVAFE